MTRLSTDRHHPSPITTPPTTTDNAQAGPTPTIMRASALLLALMAVTAQAFLAPVPAPAHSQRVAPVRMGFFDALKKGFENEKLDTPAPNAGLKNVRT